MKTVKILPLVLVFGLVNSVSADVVKIGHISVVGIPGGVGSPDPVNQPNTVIESWGNWCIGTDCVVNHDFGLQNGTPVSGGCT